MAVPALAEVLSVCTSIDNARRKAGEEQLKQISRSTDYLHQLLHCAQTCADLQVSKMQACILIHMGSIL